MNNMINNKILLYLFTVTIITKQHVKKYCIKHHYYVHFNPKILSYFPQNAQMAL